MDTRKKKRMPEGKVKVRENRRKMAVKRLRGCENPEVSYMGTKRHAAVLTAQEVCVGVPGVGRRLVSF